MPEDRVKWQIFFELPIFAAHDFAAPLLAKEIYTTSLKAKTPLLTYSILKSMAALLRSKDL